MLHAIIATRAGRRFPGSVTGLLVLVLGSATATADDDAYHNAREQFLRAYTTALEAAAEIQGPLPAESDSEALRTYPLYPYLQRARITHALGPADDNWTAADEQARDFLDLHDVEPVAADLRRAWLKSLARRKHWQPFLEQYRAAVADATLHCQFLAARIALEQTAELEAAVIDRWLTPQQLPPECEAPFEWLRTQKAMTEELIEQRVRLLLHNGQIAFARMVARRLSPQRAQPLLQWADLLERPATSIDALIAAPGTAVEGDALLAGWNKLARNDPAAALARYERLISARATTAQQASQLALGLALGLTWDRRPEALALFQRIAANDLDDYALTWQARAALWAGDWQQAEQSIGTMSAEQREQARWRYWAARTAQERGYAELARQLYRSVLSSDNYYSASAAARLGERAKPHPELLQHDAEQLLAASSRPGFIRARELLLCQLPAAATSEWLAEFAELAEHERTQVIHLAARWGWHDVSVATATSQSIFYDYALLYPRPYEDAVRAAARLTKLDSPLIYGVIRQESLFRADAVSPAGAMGLAQLLPETARRIAREWQQPIPQPADLLDPAVNVRLAASHLRTLIDRFDDQLVVALAGYNAGPLAAQRWLPDRPIDSDVWVENIPYNETREYVQRVLWHSVVFGWLPNGRSQNTESWLRQIAPQDSRSADAR
ncbi:MAG TPA: transglycosylase SLT domain-containing protein [Gammaproteobacteria bacterium]|nr:transglycosylase SLT domain-containing protein [Gammaproteobacteria bacterium]